MTSLLLERPPAEKIEDEDVTHIARDFAGTISLCGIDITNDAWVCDFDDSLECPDCARVEAEECPYPGECCRRAPPARKS